ncbi:3-isopropylmalate dehydrogenase [Puniceibacterium sp. IMCC21224]|uniref:3-isopropylmalate dehydrogenase n=1 Tax=Puniceibacterium sp. IMCC21224 TaxID=1618204 RepID=UPI00064E0C5B|nr:3-isopropylmalate dehydrogenase [Puniceibacterium sp. IMCC21224]KMK64940.1 3-isopropylmalate dehydrogenase [Puniceibacterium sp. IMCC21224]
MTLKILVLPGDGIGKEVTAEAVKVLKTVVEGVVDLDLRHGMIGGDAIDTVGDALPQETVDLARECDAILLGGTGVKEDEKRAPSEGAGHGLLRLRKALELYANLRPVKLYPELVGASTLRPEVVEGVDMVILRELNGDLYFGEPRGIFKDETGARYGINTMRYSESEIERIARAGFELARKRRGKLCSVDKANVLETMTLWRQVVIEVSADYPDVELSHLFIDAASMALIRDPKQFDVIVTGNVFGDIISDAAAMLAGSIGMLPSASLADGDFGLYEPVHGTAPDIAGQNLANPLAAILSVAMMLRHSFKMEAQASRIEAAIQSVLAQGYRTADMQQDGCTVLGTREMGDVVVDAVRHLSQDIKTPAETV